MLSITIMSNRDGATPSNRLLAALPQEEYQRIAPHLVQVSLHRGQVLYEIGETIEYVYFPHRSLISLVWTTEEGINKEIGLVGSEGIVGVPVFLGGKSTNNTAVVQISDSAMKLSSKVLMREFERRETLQKVLLLYTQALITQISQSSITNSQAKIEERLAYWLLLANQCTQKNNLSLTQEFIANMLGTRRASISEAAGHLSEAGLISYSRGKIAILDSSGLEAVAGEGYQEFVIEFERLLNTKN